MPEEASADALFVDLERRLKAYHLALWDMRPSIRTLRQTPGLTPQLRPSFNGPIIRLPESLAVPVGANAASHYRAMLAHIGAHATYGGAKFKIGTLKPIQAALVSLIEDARVEALSLRDFPGLGRLWRPYHVALPGSAAMVDLLMPRLARALIDPEYRDDNPWVAKGVLLFQDARERWNDPSISRGIGGLLGNDLGQMRIQFNARTYVVSPAYRDDNSGLWDYGEPPADQAETEETILDSVRIEKIDDGNSPKQEEAEDADSVPSNRARLSAMAADAGIPVASYPEWDYVSATSRNDWTTLIEFETKPASADAIKGILERYADAERRIEKLVKSAAISRPIRLRRQPQGERLDLDSAIHTMIDQRLGMQPDPRVYETSKMRNRDLSVLLLMDISESTRDRVDGTTTTIISVERAAAALLAQAMALLGDPFAIQGFCSNGRNEVRSYRIKDFGAPYDDGARGRLAGMRGMLSTRLGAALRHAGSEVGAQHSHRRLVLVVTDGEPADVDVDDPLYLVEDARKAVQELGRLGVDVFCVCLKGEDDNYLSRIFGRNGYLIIDRVEALPEKLPLLYCRLTR